MNKLKYESKSINIDLKSQRRSNENDLVDYTDWIVYENSYEKK